MSDNPLFIKPYQFNLSKDDFETLIAYFTPKDDILKILAISDADMNSWCEDNYGLKFNEVYDNLLALARTHGRIMITKLADGGNNTALGIYSKYFAKFEEEQQSKADTIPIIAVIPLPDKTKGGD